MGSPLLYTPLYHDLKKGGGGFFERERKLQTTLTRIFIVLESESHGLSDFGRFILEIETEISAKIGNSNAFSGRITTSTLQLWIPISFGGGAVFIFSPKIGLKSTKNVRFCILYRPMGGLEPPSPPLATLLLQNMFKYLAIIFECFILLSI